MTYVLIAEPDPSRALVYKNLVSDAGLQAALVRDGEHAQFMLRSKGLPTLLITASSRRSRMPETTTAGTSLCPAYSSSDERSARAPSTGRSPGFPPEPERSLAGR